MYTIVKTSLNDIDITLVNHNDPDYDKYYELYHFEGDWSFRFDKGWSLMRFMQAAGVDIGKIDYAVPQEWHDKYRNTLGQAVWSYEDNSLMGFPIFYDEAWLRIKAQLSLRV